MFPLSWLVREREPVHAWYREGDSLSTPSGLLDSSLNGRLGLVGRFGRRMTHVDPSYSWI